MPAAPLPPAPPPSPSRHRIKAGGLVSGTGRLKHVKRRQHQLQQQHHSNPPPPPPPPSTQLPTQASQPLTPREQFAKYYGFTLPPAPPRHEDPDAGYPFEHQGGIINTTHLPNSIANSLSSSSTASSSSSSSSSSSNSSASPQRWINNSYNYPPQSANPCSLPPPPLPAQFRRSSSYRASTSAPSYPSPLDHDELLAKFNDQFVHSRTQSATTAPEPPTSPTKRERSLLPPGAEGKLIVPDVKLKVRCSSSASLESPPSRKSPQSRKSPLSAPGCVHEFNKREVFTSFTLKRPSFETRSWSYDNVQTYPIMQLPPRKEKQMVKKIVDGEEKEVEIEVEVYEEPKKLFLFAPKVVLL